MPSAVRSPIDVSTGHGCFPSKKSISGSPNVIINGYQSHRVGDPWEIHCCGPVCHDSIQDTGSPNVLVNGKNKARVGDILSCGGKDKTGSPNVIVN